MSFINGEDVSSEIAIVGNSTSRGNNIYLNRTAENSIRMLLYRDQSVYAFTVTRREEILDFVINLDTSLMGETRGLFGNFNEDDKDDFIKPNGITLPFNASDELLHEFGQSCECNAVLYTVHSFTILRFPSPCACVCMNKLCGTKCYNFKTCTISHRANH